MQLIEEIEISYFRSFYKETLAGCQHTNIIFGKNDSGKSNTLRALNLFFNGFTSPGQLFNFERDLNHSRRAEAEVDDGVERRKFIYVKVHFRTPDGWNKSLGKKFWVKKQWSVSFEDEPQLSTSISGNKIYLKKFLKKIKLHYIPAIKDRTIFERLQAEIYKSIASSGEFHNSLEKFSDDLRGRTEELSKKILSDTSIMSALNAPKDLTDLFRSLDFETQSDIGDSYSLTLQRGDGIQVR
ncbi:AAA family ATPase, partial [Pseudomonas aeruginosa]